MNNLFAVFDPRTRTSLSLNWFSSLLLLLFVPVTFWGVKPNFLKLVSNVTANLNFEFKINLGNNVTPGITLLRVSLFIFIVLNNRLGLLPYVFTSTSHIRLTLGLAFPLWVGFTLYTLVKIPSFWFAHLVPLGTPVALMIFMVLIELVRAVIRPLTLAVRLIANMVAGHLLMSLIRNFLLLLPFYTIAPSSIVLLALVVLECAVARIQAYVFRLLINLYIREINIWRVN